MNPLTALYNAFLLASDVEKPVAAMMLKRGIEVVPPETKYDFILDFSASLVSQSSSQSLEEARKDLDVLFSTKENDTAEVKYEIAVAMLTASAAKTKGDQESPATQVIDLLTSAPTNSPQYN